jgi:hypothetical protein
MLVSVVEAAIVALPAVWVISPPPTERSDPGVVEPMPRLPFDARKSELVAVMVLVFEKYGNCPVVPE